MLDSRIMRVPRRLGLLPAVAFLSFAGFQSVYAQQGNPADIQPTKQSGFILKSTGSITKEDSDAPKVEH